MMRAARRWRVVGVVAVGLVACLAATVLIVTLTRNHAARKVVMCADVGLRGPSAPTPEGALAAYVAANAGDGPDWRRVGHSTIRPDHASGIAPFESYSFMPRHRVAHPSFSRITVSNRFGTWAASGACV